MKNNAYIILGNPPTVGFAENGDKWLNLDSGKHFLQIYFAVLKNGYQGVQHNRSELHDGYFLWMPRLNLSTPEGRMVDCLMDFARAGIEPPTVDECLSILQTIYLEQGLQPPVMCQTAPCKSDGDVDAK